MGSVSIVVQVGQNSTALITCSDFRAYVYIEALYPSNSKHNFAMAFPALKAPKRTHDEWVHGCTNNPPLEQMWGTATRGPLW